MEQESLIAQAVNIHVQTGYFETRLIDCAVNDKPVVNFLNTNADTVVQAGLDLAFV